jgi:hypothetical protein
MEKALGENTVLHSTLFQQPASHWRRRFPALHSGLIPAGLKRNGGDSPAPAPLPAQFLAQGVFLQARQGCLVN